MCREDEPKTFCVAGLNAAYAGGFALRDVTFSARAGEITGIIGPNGSGKTTLLKALCRDIPATGEAKIGARDLFHNNIAERARRIAIVPQTIEPIPVPLLDYVLTGRTPYKKWYRIDYTDRDREIALRSMETSGLTAIFTEAELQVKKVSELSGGERQLCALAKALCQEPEILLLDEPTANLDLARRIQTLDRIAGITTMRQCCTLLVIHDVNLAAEYCAHLVCFSHGKLLFEGRTAEVLTRAQMEKVYETPLCVGKHPLSGKPLILPVSGGFGE